MKVALIFLPSWSVQAPPLGPACIAAALKGAGHDARVFDWNVELYRLLEPDLWDLANDTEWCQLSRFLTWCLPRIKGKLDPMLDSILAQGFDVVGFSIFSSSVHTAAYASGYLKRRNPNIKVIWGGPGILWPDITDYVISVVDAAVVGEGEGAAVSVLEAWKNNLPLTDIPGVIWKDEHLRPVVNDRQKGLPINQIPYPDFSDFKFDKYLERLVPIQLSRGCVANCSFCEEKKFLWPGFQMKEPQRIVDEFLAIKKATGIPSFCAADSLMNGDHRKLEALADLLIAENAEVHWGGNMRIDVKLTPALLKKLKQAGCHWVTFGVESGSDDVLKFMRKGIRSHHIGPTLKNVHEANIRIGVNIIVGFPGEYESQYNETVRMLDDCRQYISNISTAQFSIGPRSPIALQRKDYDILLDDSGEVVWDDNPNDGVGWFSRNRVSTRAIRNQRLNHLRSHIESSLSSIVHNRVADCELI